MTVTVDVVLNGVCIPVELDDDALAAIASRLTPTSSEPWPEWMSVDTVARYLDCSPERIRKLAARREIPYAQEGVGCRLSFSRQAIDDWMQTLSRDSRPSRPDSSPADS